MSVGFILSLIKVGFARELEIPVLDTACIISDISLGHGTIAIIPIAPI